MERLRQGQRVERDKFQSDNEKFHFLLENSGDIIWTIDLDFKWRFITSNVERIVHIKASDIIGKSVWDFVAPEYHDMLMDKFQRRLNGEDIPAYEVMINDGYGRRIPFEVKTTPIVDKDGKILGIQGISRDITERKRTEEAARKSEEKFRDLIENIYDWVWETDVNVVFTYSNPQVRDYLGYAPEEVIGRSMYDFMKPEMGKRITGMLGGMIKHRAQVAIAEKTMIAKDGNPVDFEMTVSLIATEDGTIVGFRGICRDIRDRKRAEEARRKAYGELEKRVAERTEALVRAQATMQSILETAPIGIIVVDAETKMIMFHSREIEKIFGRSLPGTIYGLNIYPYRLLQPDGSLLRDEDLPLKISIKSGASVTNKEIKVKTENGTERTILVSSAPIKSSDGRVTAAVASIFDITRIRYAENEVMEAKAQAEMYLDLMGHDINNLNQAGIGYLELALDAIRSKSKLESSDILFLNRAMEALTTSSQLIDNVQKLQRTRAGGLKHKAIDLCDILTELKDHYSHVPDRKIAIRLSTNNYCFVVANELIHDVFSNLIGNAIKHSPPERPLEIDVSIRNIIVDDEALYEISVDDNGPGIPDELKSRLFARFQRGKTKTSGRGLGLYLVKTLVEDFKGNVRVEDRVKGDYKKGARFVVRLPVASVDPQPAA